MYGGHNLFSNYIMLVSINLGVVKIDVNNRHEIDSNKIKVVEGKYEYHRQPLEGSKSTYIYIPLSVITDTELDIRRISVFTYFRIHYGLNNIVGFTVPDIVEWYGGKPDRRANGSNDKTLSTIDTLSDRGYLTYLTEKSKSSYMKCKFNTNYYYDECSNGFATIYLDEIEKIMSYKKENSKDSTLNNSTILLAFSYFRNKIKRRPNELKPEERTPDGILQRRERIPDAYYDNINNIANEIGISSKTLSKIIDILEYDLKLIVTDKAYRVKNRNNEFRTLPIIFANSYKREDKYLLVTGDGYSRAEIKLKTKTIKDYKIDKRKRKKTKGGDNDE